MGDGSVTIGAVVIGRNEGERLVRCLRSLQGKAATLVYVDSGSADDSLAAARAAGAIVVELDAATPFTAARARNAGVAALVSSGAAAAYVQFVDGDCELAPGWIEAARDFLASDPAAAVACGRRRERAPESSLWNRLIDMEWNTPVGQARACGGDSLMRLAAFRAVGGFNDRLIAGEEPELCFRLREAGWTVWRLDREMTLHDAAITRFGQWWRRAVRGGWAYSEGAAMHGASPEGYNRRQLRSILIWGGAVPAMALVGAIAALLPDLRAGGLLMLAGLAVAVPGMALRIARYRRRQAADPWPDALAYGAFTMLGKLPQLQGVLRYWRQRHRAGPARIIEYKA